MPTKTPPISSYEFTEIILQKQNNKNFKKIINDILDLEIDSDNSYDVSECNTIIDNFLKLGEALKKYEFFEKAGYVFDEILPMAHDYYEFDDYNEDNWFERENNIEPEQVHYSTAKKMLSSSIRRVIKELNPPKDALLSLKSYIIPIYSKIKMIDIDGEIFKTLSEAQTHLNMLILEDPYIYLVDKIGCDIKIILEDEFLTNYFNETDMSDDWEFVIKDCFNKAETTFHETSIVDALLICLDVRNELIDDIARENNFSNMDDFNYESFKHYKEESVALWTLEGVYLPPLFKEDINRDIDMFLAKYHLNETFNSEILELAFKVVMDSYGRDIEFLERLDKKDDYNENDLQKLENKLDKQYDYSIEPEWLYIIRSYFTLKRYLAPSIWNSDNYSFKEKRKYIHALDMVEYIKNPDLLNE